MSRLAVRSVSARPDSGSPNICTVSAGRRSGLRWYPTRQAVRIAVRHMGCSFTRGPVAGRGTVGVGSARAKPAADEPAHQTSVGVGRPKPAADEPAHRPVGSGEGGSPQRTSPRIRFRRGGLRSGTMTPGAVPTGSMTNAPSGTRVCLWSWRPGWRRSRHPESGASRESRIVADLLLGSSSSARAAGELAVTTVISCRRSGPVPHW